MLELRPCCECCATPLPGDSRDAMICSFECTYCRSCAGDQLKGKCPNCGGELQPRPARVGEKLVKNPATTVRTVKAQGCSAH
ncbi:MULTISPECIES: DUF1272 domain-containing protein [Pseudomonas]|uniref:DUF1272 domain-containing protein n=1 Tax=Pseudomonas TaxID=286 RepID=UPI0009BEB227|nr:DUF1272 domain-containing protein [Pseudomonas putida]